MEGKANLQAQPGYIDVLFVALDGREDVDSLIRYINQRRPKYRPIESVDELRAVARQIADAHAQLGIRQLKEFYRRNNFRRHDRRIKILKKIAAMDRARRQCE